jgi:RNA polymerase sigma-70 factor (ECF subfamily)
MGGLNEVSGLAAIDPAATSRSGDAAVLLIHADAVNRFCRSQLPSAADAEDAVQDTFVRFLQRSDAEVRNPQAWLIAVAKRACRDVMKERQGDELNTERLRSHDEAPEDVVLTSTLVGELLKTLRVRDAQLLAELYMAGKSIEQVAVELNTSAGHVRVLALRARRRARKALEEMGAGRGAYALFPGWVLRKPKPGSMVARLEGRISAARGRAARILSEIGGPAEGMLARLAIPAGLVILVASGGIRGTDTGHDSSPSRVGSGGTGVVALASSTADAAPAGNAAASGSTKPVAGGSAPTGAPADWLSGFVGASRNPKPVDAGFSSLASSPSYPTDHTVFASGLQTRGCPSCPVLFVTHDGGVTWTKLAAIGFAGGDILLPGAFPRDPAVFAIGASGLQRSDDGGATFRTLVPGVTRGAIDTGAPAGASHIILATAPLLLYSEASNGVAPGPPLPPGVVGVYDAAFEADSSHMAVLAQKVDPLAAGQADAILANCDSVTCSTVATFSGGGGSRLVVSPTFKSDHFVAALVNAGVEVSRDGGLAYQPLATPDGLRVTGVALDSQFATRPELVIEGMTASPAGNIKASVLRSVDSGMSFAALPVPGPVAATVLLPDGRIIAAVTVSSQSGDFGLACSTDGGTTWESSC